MKLNLVFATFVFFAQIAPAFSASLTAKEIMAKHEDAREVKDVTSSATLTTGGPDRPEKTKQFTWWRKLTEDKVHFNTLTRFHSPAEVRGEGILFLERENNQNDIQLYLPAYKKIRRVESQAQSGSFMGSEFSYADIATPHLNDYTYTLLKEEECVTDDGTKLRCSVIESKPTNDEVRERTGYSKSIQWVRPDNFMAVKGELYGTDGELLKNAQYSQITEVDKAQHKWMSQEIRIQNAKNKRYTVLKFSNVKVNTGIPDSTFTQQNLSRER